MKRYDVVVIGGGVAGLSGALTLGRARRSVLVIDAGEPRNAPAHEVHGYLGREGTPPAELLAAGREESARYGVEIVEGTVRDVSEHDDGFLVTYGGERVAAGRLLIASGLVDRLPAIEGVAERWGSMVLHCPYCHGWEVRDQPIGVLTAAQAQLWRQWSADITLFASEAGDLGDLEREQLAARGVTVREEKLAALEDGGARLSDGALVPLTALVVAPRMVVRVPAGLGLAVTELESGSHIAVDPKGATSVQGVWAAGNAANLMDTLMGSAASGVVAAAAINADLIAEETSRAHARHFWEARYGESDQIWSGRPNPALVTEIEDLTPGTALDLGCGEGADAIWLAARGWRVTGVDISQTAIDRAAVHASAEGVELDLRRLDLGVAFPEGEFDLVAASFLHSETGLDRESVLRRAVRAVAPGGTLLIVGHSGSDSTHAEHHPGLKLPSPQEVLTALDLPEQEWEVRKLEEYEEPRHDRVTTNNTLRLRRR